MASSAVSFSGFLHGSFCFSMPHFSVACRNDFSILAKHFCICCLAKIVAKLLETWLWPTASPFPIAVACCAK